MGLDRFVGPHVHARETGAGRLFRPLRVKRRNRKERHPDGAEAAGDFAEVGPVPGIPGEE
jgi:hypothetical protein